MGNIEFFNELAHKRILSNARMVSLNFDVYAKTFADIDRKLKFTSADSVLDLGGGTGQIAGLIARKSRQVVLTDGAAEALKVARESLANPPNVSCRQLNLERLPLPFAGDVFDKVVCYSVVHYLSDHNHFIKLLSEMLRVTKPGGQILVGDIPLTDKGRQYLAERRKHPFRNLLGNLQYYLKKTLTTWRYHLKGINDSQISGLAYTKTQLASLLGRLRGINYEWLEQDSNLPFVNSREDLLITKR